MHLASAELCMTIARMLRTLVRTEMDEDGEVVVKEMRLWETGRGMWIW
jgi:hypothetical protein